jgi:hypothetical protein
MENYKQALHTRNQIDAEIEALQLLWSGTIRTFTPNRKHFNGWLRLVGYVEVTRAVNDVARQFIQRNGAMLPGQLISMMDRRVSDTIIRQKKAAELQKVSA